MENLRDEWEKSSLKFEIRDKPFLVEIVKYNKNIVKQYSRLELQRYLEKMSYITLCIVGLH